ncbi:MAG: DNA-3-methyladenine glycosylase [Patescibacteria group bacterium]|nr:DNA-3-methyladenine glycosylase [Patescibacteria group bacterium]MCL5431501.1 DNA-3-methyladenine glycosylase [Patescibacteria group bacterium]
MKPLPREFYNRPAKVVARALLGKIIVRGKLTEKITQTEAYVGPQDLASHSRFGKTARNQVMFGPPGFAYVYLVYGKHFCFNVVTGRPGLGAAVLIRATQTAPGPGLVCQKLAINKKFYGADLTKKGPLFIADGPKPKKISVLPRVGISYAGTWKDAPLRFVISS